MLSPSRLALFPASALFVAGIVLSAVTGFGGSKFDPTAMALAATGFAFIAALVWLGSYMGARPSAPQHRTARLARALALLCGIFGAALGIPIRTHAVLVDMPAAGSGPSPYWTPEVVSIAALLASVLISLFLVRILATICARAVARGA
jgi:hypothetical protein